MDLSDALFSPSKARQQQAQAKDWIFVDSWLSRKYHPKPVPAFERNEETLQSLMTLVAFNERADEERALVERVERQALKELQEQQQDPVNETIYTALQSHLRPSGQTHLLSQAETSVLLNAANTAPPTLAHHTAELTTAQFNLDQQLLQITHLEQTLAREQKRLDALLQHLRSEVFAVAGDVPRQTTTWTRDTKALQLKLDEYGERLSQHRGVTPPRPGVAEVAERWDGLLAVKGRLRDVEGKIEWYEGLPPDVGEARRVLEDLKVELRELVDRRNAGFEGLIDGGGGRSRLPLRTG